MQKVDIYLETDSIQQAAAKRKYGYVLATTYKGKLETREGFGQMDGTYHQTILRALCEALNRMRVSCEITIYSRNAHVMAHVKKIQEMEEMNFKDSKGNDIRNHDQWKIVSREAKKHHLETKYGHHEYTNWLMDEMRKR